MLALSLRFLTGRFHATPWGRHVNEGAPEWPPSPWRLLRALVACWKQRLEGHPDCPPDQVEAVLRALASAPPAFKLPPASAGHSRHYMPGEKKPTLVFDAFVVVEPKETLIALWPELTLPEPARRCLATLLAHLTTLGRAESWVEAQLLPEGEAVAPNCRPGSPTSAEEAVLVLCADGALAFGNEHAEAEDRDEGRGKAKVKRRVPLQDPDWHLCVETRWIQKNGWSAAPGSAAVTYARARDAFALRRTVRTRATGARPTVARFALDGAVLPTIAETLPIAEAARRVAMGAYRRLVEAREGVALPRSEIFSGKQADGRPRTDHGHAYYLPTDEDGDGKLDHLTVVASLGFGPDERLTLGRMTWLPWGEGEGLNLVLLALGTPERLGTVSALGLSRAWISATPYLASRHPKRTGQKRDAQALLHPEARRLFAQHNLAEELARAGLPPATIEPLDEHHRCGALKLRPLQFKRFRQKRGDDGGRRPSGAFKIVFEREIAGPLCLGHSSHFGLGLFLPDLP